MYDITSAVSALNNQPLSEELVCKHLHPLFKQTLQMSTSNIYLANHSLGRPLDKTKQDVEVAIKVWYENLTTAWEYWGEQIESYRQQITKLIHAPNTDCIVPKLNAGQGLRTILNCYDEKIGVLTTSDEFTSLDFILKNYQLRGRIDLKKVAPTNDRYYATEALIQSIDKSIHLVVVSLVLFTTGQFLDDLAEITRAAHQKGVFVLVDLYHAAGIVPVDVSLLEIDFAVGGCYKYLRGGPGACWLYIHPRHLDGSLRTLDIGWFAQPDPFNFQRPEKVEFASGGDAFLESTPAVLTYYQAKAGLEFVLALGVPRLRDYSLYQQNLLCELLQQQGISMLGNREKYGAFIALPHSNAEQIMEQLFKERIITDSREGYLRICPDILNTTNELETASIKIANYLKT
ncbi:MAG: aminotransferase class V-fold PLP-dependent enzyme [Gammaproteobacteria bacterium]